MNAGGDNAATLGLYVSAHCRATGADRARPVSAKAGDYSPWSDRPSPAAVALVEFVQPDACCTLAFWSRAGVASLQEVK